MQNKIFNKTFWRFLTGFLVVLAVSLFLIIIAGNFAEAPADAEGSPDEDCMIFC